MFWRARLPLRYRTSQECRPLSEKPGTRLSPRYSESCKGWDAFRKGSSQLSTSVFAAPIAVFPRVFRPYVRKVGLSPRSRGHCSGFAKTEDIHNMRTCLFSPSELFCARGTLLKVLMVIWNERAPRLPRVHASTANRPRALVDGPRRQESARSGHCRLVMPWRYSQLGHRVL